MKTINIETVIFQSLSKCLLFNVRDNVRAICCDWECWERFKIRAYLTTEPTEEDEELLSVIMTEFFTYISFEKYEHECIRANTKLEDLDLLRMVVFARHEGPVFTKWDPETGGIIER